MLTANSDLLATHSGTSEALMVAVTLGGIVLPRYGEQPSHPLTPSDLVLIRTLARPGSGTVHDAVESVVLETGQPVEAFDQVVAALTARGLIGRSAPPAPSPPEELYLPPAALPIDADRETQLVLAPSLVLRVRPSGFEHVDYHGNLDARLEPAELHAASQFRLPNTVEKAREAHEAEAGGLALDAGAFEVLTDRLIRGGLLERFDPDNPAHAGFTKNVEHLTDAIRRKHGVMRAMDREVAVRREADERRDEGSGVARTRVVPAVGIDNYWALPPVALGFLVSYATAYEGGRLTERYDFLPRWVSTIEQLADAARQPGIFLFSNYIWSHQENLALSAMVKELNPSSITIHGGPNTPKYEGDCERHFAEHPHVDITVRGEGEATFAEILDALGPLGPAPPDLEVLADVAGLSYRRGDRAVHTSNRDRISDLETIPSPYLTGLFDSFGGGLAEAMILETNRGCPYGCTFCDWGSATLSRIRKFDLDRVFAELEWCARNKIHTVSVADANYGIFERDIAIAEKVAELKTTYGYPQLFATNYAKNTVKHLRPIIEVLAEAGIITEGKVSLQSMDTDTLLTIKRSNIKVEKYNDLAAEFRKAKLPLTVDLMMGLPGATASAFRGDLQECIDREMPAIVHTTTLLANSPMNDPEYRVEHGIDVLPGAVVDQTNTFTKQEFDRMNLLRGVYLVCDKYGVLRQVATFVRKETGLREIEFYERLLDEALAHPDRWPTLAYTLQAAPELMAAPCSWKLLIDEVGDFLVEVLGVADDDSLATVLRVQHALQPASGRAFPDILELPHDYGAWYRAVQESKESGRGDWEVRVQGLRELPPGTFVVEDPGDVCRSKIGGSVDSLSMTLLGWELVSPVTRTLMASVPG